MDISAILCATQPTEENVTVEWYVNSDPSFPLNPQYKIWERFVPEDVVFFYPEKYATLQKAKDGFSAKTFREARDNTNPFEFIGKSTFMNRAAVKLGNIDAVHHISGTIFTYDRRTSMSPFTFCDIAAGPGSFTQYLQYRYPNSRGYGITLKEKLDWNTQLLDMKRFKTIYGSDGRGDLYTSWEDFIEKVLQEQPQGVDLVTGDGGFDTDHHEEYLSSRLILLQATIGVACTRVGGNFLLKIFDTVTTASAHVLYLLSRCFQRILLWKPVSSRPANAERYVICMGRRSNVQLNYKLMTGAIREGDTVQSLFSETLPPPFQEWLWKSNILGLRIQAAAIKTVLSYMSGVRQPLPTYDLQKFLIIWHLPDNQ